MYDQEINKKIFKRPLINDMNTIKTESDSNMIDLGSSPSAIFNPIG